MLSNTDSRKDFTSATLVYFPCLAVGDIFYCTVHIRKIHPT